MEEIHHDNADGQSPALILPGHLQQLLLGLVAELALPVAHGEFRHHGHLAGGVRVGLLDLGGGIPGGDPVVQLLGGEGLPGGDVFAEIHPSNGGVVPQEAIAQGTEEEGNAGLGIPLRQLQVGTLQIQEGLLILAHAVELFLGIGDKPGGEPVVAADDGLELSGFHIQRAAGGAEHVPAIPQVLLQQHFPSLVIEGQLADEVQLRPDIAVYDAAAVLPDLDHRVAVRLGKQCPVLGVRLRLLPGPDPEGVFAPGLDPQPLRPVAVAQGVSIPFKKTVDNSYFVVICHILFPF